MEYLREVNDRFSISLSHPDIDDFERLLESGYTAVVNLRRPDEPGQALTPERERSVATKVGMLYAHIPVSDDQVSDKLVDEFRECVAGLKGRILVHSGTGERSAAFTMMHIGSERGLSGKEAVEQARKISAKWDNEELAHFVENYVDRHSVDIHNV